MGDAGRRRSAPVGPTPNAGDVDVEREAWKLVFTYAESGFAGAACYVEAPTISIVNPRRRRFYAVGFGCKCRALRPRARCRPLSDSTEA
jgi:hypothetical protein